MLPSEITIAPMTEALLLWRCLHGGPLSKENVDDWQGQAPQVPWAALHARNLPLLRKLTATYGACAMLAWAGDEVVGTLRFYPKAIAALNAGMMCLQQDYPAGPAAELVEQPFPPLAELADQTLAIHCLMTGAPNRENPYQRKGVGSALVRALLDWARGQSWQVVEAHAYEDLPLLYAITGVAGKRFYEKLGFTLVETGIEEGLLGESDFTRTLRQQAVALGLPEEQYKNKHTMRFEL